MQSRRVGGNEIDIALYADVLRRHRAVVLVGVALAVALAVLSYVRVSPSGISYRSPETWSNQATLVLTQEGAPELRSVLPARPGGFSPTLADTGRFASLIDVYATLATSDAVVGQLRRHGLIKEKDLKDGALPIAAAAVPSTVNAATPMMTITATGSTGPKATKLTLGATRAFLDVLNTRQLAAKIPVKDRIQVRVVKSSEAPKLINPRSKALPIIVLLSGLIATAAVAFTRDNLARRERAPELTRRGLAPNPPIRTRRSRRLGPLPVRTRLRRVRNLDRRSVSPEAVRRSAPYLARTRLRRASATFPTKLPSKLVDVRSAAQRRS